MSDEQLLKKYEEMDYILNLSDGFLWQDIIRTLGGGIVFLLSWLNGFIEGIIDKVITFNNFYSSGPMKEFMDVARPVVWGVFFIALFVLGFQLMLNKVEKRNEIVLNVILALCFIVVLPDLMSNLGQITNQGIKALNPESESLAGELVKSNVADVLYYAERGFNYSSNKNGNENRPPLPQSKGDTSVGTTDFTYANQLPSEHTWVYIPYTQKLDVHDTTPEALENLSDDAIEVLSHQAIATGSGTGQTVEELKKNVVFGTSLGRESYYRYHVNWMVLIISLLVTTIALAITVVKIGRSIFDLAFHQVYGMFIAATDLTGGQRTKKVLTEIISTFAVIFIMTMLLKFFMMYSIWANSLKSNIGAIGVLLLLIAGAWALIDAPDIVQRTLGIDAGLRSGWQAMMGAYAGAKVAGAVGGAVKKKMGGMKNKGSSEKNSSSSKENVKQIPESSEEQQNSSGASSEKNSSASKENVKQIPESSGNQQNSSGASSEKNSNASRENIKQIPESSGNQQNSSGKSQDSNDSQKKNRSAMNSQSKEHSESRKLHPETREKKESIPSQNYIQQGNYQEKKQKFKQKEESIPLNNSKNGSKEADSRIPGSQKSNKSTSETKIPNQQNRKSPPSNTRQKTMTSNGSKKQKSHQETREQNTRIGRNQGAQNVQAKGMRERNSSFNLGQNIRRVSSNPDKKIERKGKGE